MPRKKKEIGYIAILKRMIEAGIAHSPAIKQHADNSDLLLTLSERVQHVLSIVNNKKRLAGKMLFFVMYDIESNKVRRYVVKYLEKKGCTRIQKSIFLADLSLDKYESIRNDLTEVQAAYDNNDSILVVPITTDYLKAMKVIGQNLDVDIITHTRNTLFF